MTARSLLISRVIKLDKFGVDIIVLACNTAHIIYPELIKYTNSYFPSLIDLVSTKASRLKLRRVGIFATPTTIKSGLYQNKLAKFGISAVIPSQKTINYLEMIIRKLITGENINQDKLFRIGKNFIKKNNLDGLILGCTELPLVFPKNKFLPNQILDSLDILADTLINYVRC